MLRIFFSRPNASLYRVDFHDPFWCPQPRIIFCPSHNPRTRDLVVRDCYWVDHSTRKMKPTRKRRFTSPDLVQMHRVPAEVLGSRPTDGSILDSTGSASIPGHHLGCPLTRFQRVVHPTLYERSSTHFGSVPTPNQSYIGNSTHLSVESQSDNGVDPDDAALHLSPHRKDALRALPFPVSPAGEDSRPRTLRRYLSQRPPARCRSPRLRGEAGH